MYHGIDRVAHVRCALFSIRKRSFCETHALFYPHFLAVCGVREIWLILDEKERIDAIDEQEGQKVQDMVR